MVKRTSLFAGCLGLLICALAPPADAVQVMSGYGAFRPRLISNVSQQCITERGGGALNQCTAARDVIFDLPINEGTVPTTYSITARSFAVSSASAAFDCQAIALNPTSTVSSNGSFVSFAATSGIDTKSFGVVVPAGWSLRLQCRSLPVNKGILNIRWTGVVQS